MKEFIDKLISRLEEEHERCINRYGIVGGNAPAMEVKQCMDIVNELAEEYKGGWIACSERLPELTEGTEYFKQSKCCLVALKWWDGDITESVAWYNQSGVWNEDSKNCKVIAWQPLPAPYTEGE